MPNQDSREEEGAQFVLPQFAGQALAHNLKFHEEVLQMRREGREVFHFAFGESPFPVPLAVQTALKEFVGNNEYPPVAGLESLRRGISWLHEKQEGLYLDPKDIVVGPGLKQLIFLIVHCFSGDIVLISPAWPTYAPQVQLALKSPVIVESHASNNWLVSPQDLEETLASCKSPTRLLILTNPGNPSGTAYNEEDLQPLVDVCRRNNTLIMSDEIYAFLKFGHCKPHFSVAKLYPEGTILGGGMSKWGASGGFRLGYVHFPPQLGVLRRAVLMASSQTHTSPACPIQHAYAEVLNSDEGRREIANFIEGSRLILEAVARYVERELTSVGVKCVPSDAGFYVMPDFANIREGLNMRGITTGIDMTSAMLHEAGVGLLPGEAFLRPSSELTTRLCFINFDGGPFLASILDRLPGATITDEDIRRFCPKTVQGIEAIKAFIMKHQMPER